MIYVIIYNKGKKIPVARPKYKMKDKEKRKNNNDKRLPELSIVILTYNVRELLADCLTSILKSKPPRAKWQIIVIDNASTDHTAETITKRFPAVELIKSKKNLGFSKGNNLAIPKIKSPYVLFLNPDTVIKGNAIANTLKFIKTKPKAGAVTCKVLLPDGKIDYSCHRGFPTPWNAFCYFSGLSRIFPSLKLFAGYTASYLDLEKTHQVDCISGTFFLVKKEAAEKVGWWDTDYFWNGEDIEFCFNLRKRGFEIYYYPKEYIIHYKGSSSGLRKRKGVKVSKEIKLMAVESGIQAMRIFYTKHYLKNSSSFSRLLILFGILILEKIRLLKIRFGS